MAGRDGTTSEIKDLSKIEIGTKERGLFNDDYGQGGEKEDDSAEGWNTPLAHRDWILRWRGELLEHRTCTFCAKGEIEDEAHVLLCCSPMREKEVSYTGVFRAAPTTI